VLILALGDDVNVDGNGAPIDGPTTVPSGRVGKAIFGADGHWATCCFGSEQGNTGNTGATGAAGNTGASGNTGNTGNTGTTPAQPSVRVSRSTNQVIPTATRTAIVFDTDRFDGPGTPMWSAGQPTRLTAQVAGRYQITSQVVWADGNGALRLAEIQLNGNDANGLVFEDKAPTPGEELATNATTLWSMNAGDYVEHDATPSLAVQSEPLVSPEFMMSRVGP